ncbi:MAG: helix-turn-helix domain-containing protein [Moraxellaceae bacterium]|nr:helix-turn-helix domain-containing protein [Moraxellaceae bacterium]MDZ4387707.1 helix-turn-helix domain-containing protein [Moraxellaceae bacterium]
MRTIDLHFLSLLSAASVRTGVDLRHVMSLLQLSLNTQAERSPPLPLGVLASLVEQLEVRAARGRFVFALADVFNFDGLPAVSAYLSSANSLRQLHQFLQWVPTIVHPDLRFQIADNGAMAWLHPIVDSSDQRLHDHPLLIELMSAVVVHIGRVLSPGLEPVRQIDFRHDSLIKQQDYEDYFGCPVRFNCADNTLYGEGRLLDDRLPGSLPEANAFAEQTIQTHLLGDGVAPPFQLQVETLLRRRLSLFSDGLPALSAAMQLKPRTLQRRFREHGICYHQMIARLRHELACEMLRKTTLDIDSIALKLGYSERRSFSHAFRGWQGQSPSMYRRSI